MYNKKALFKATAELDKAKAPKKPKDIITDPMGQWKYPGEVTRIPSDNITMKGVGYPVVGVANTGQRQIMLPGADYTFPGADYVDEYPQMQKGGTSKSKSGTITNVIEKPDGSKIVQVKTKDGKYFEKVIPNNKYISPLTGKPYVPMQGDATIPSGWEAEDNTLEDISEFIDPTGITSWDDVARAYDENGLFDPKTGLEILGALPLVGKIGKSGKILAGGEKLFLDAVKYFGYNDKIANAYKAYRKFGGKNLDDVLGLTTKGLTKLSPKLNPEKWESSMKLINGLNKFTEGAKATKLLPYTPSGDTQTKNDEDYIEAELTDDEIEEYRKGGYIVEDISVPELNQAQEGLIATKEHTDKKGNKTIVVTKEDGTKYTKVIDSKGKVHNKIQPGMHPAMQDYFKKKAEWERRSSGAAQPVDDFWTLPIGMTSAGVKGAGALVKGTVAAVKGAGKSSLAQATKAGSKALFNTAPKWAPGMNLGNAIGAGFAGNALTDVVTGKVAEPWKKANKSGKGSDYADAVTETLYTAMDAIPLYGAVGKTAKQLGKYAKVKGSTKKLIPSIQASAVGETNSFVPNNLIHHPDNTYILQKTPVKDFGIKLNIKNKPDKSKHGFDVSDDEIKQVINQNLEYINHPEYIKRRQATTGESVEKIKKEIKDYTESLKHAKFDFDKVAVKNGLGAHQRGIKILGKNLVNPKITVNSSDKAIKTKYDFLHVLDHEVKHALSPVSKNAFTAFPKYKNYPHVDLVKSGNKSVYNSADYEQQVRFLRIRDHLHNKFGISKHKELSPEEWDVFKNEWNGWLKEEHIGLGNKRVPRGLKDVRGMMELKHPKVSSEQLRKIINKSWAIAPVGIAGAAVNYMPAPKKSKQMQEGGMITKLTPKEIQDYINQGYIVEEH